MEKNLIFLDVIKPFIEGYHIPWLKKLFITHEIQSLHLNNNAILLTEIARFEKGKPIFRYYCVVDMEAIKSNNDERTVYSSEGNQEIWKDFMHQLNNEISYSKKDDKYNGYIYYSDWEYDVYMCNKMNKNIITVSKEDTNFDLKAEDCYLALYLINLTYHRKLKIVNYD